MNHHHHHHHHHSHLEGMSDVIVQAVAALDHHVDELVEVDGSVGVGVHVAAKQKLSRRY